MNSNDCAQLEKHFNDGPLAVRGSGLLHIISASEVAATTAHLHARRVSSGHTCSDFRPDEASELPAERSPWSAALGLRCPVDARVTPT
jgi:hypothetical protein